MRRRGGTLTARPLGLGVLSFDSFILAPLGLPLGCLPAPNLPQAVGVLAVMLVPTPRQVLLPTALAQANPDPRSSRPDTLAAIWTTMTTTHGSLFSQGTAWGERANVLLGRLSKPDALDTCQTILPNTTRQ